MIAFFVELRYTFYKYCLHVAVQYELRINCTAAYNQFVKLKSQFYEKTIL
jgi:hypothetical protein